MQAVGLVLVLCVIAPVAQGATNAVEWCYHETPCNDAMWPTLIPQFCNGSRQSPIDIVSQNATVDDKLTNFTFTNIDSTSVFTKIENTGKTVKVSLSSGVSVSGGNLNSSYDSLQFHLHWGNGSSVPGSEHTVDGKRYAMELHIVNVKAVYNGNTTLAVADSDGLAALGFFIDVSTNTTGEPAAWKTLTSYLHNITESGQSANMSDAGISLLNLVPGVDTTKYYRYLGSLTTPLCQEAVVWTVFQDPVMVSQDLIDLFSKTVRIGNSSSEFMVNVYRNVQAAQPVTVTPSSSSGSKMNYSYGLFVLIAALWMR